MFIIHFPKQAPLEYGSPLEFTLVKTRARRPPKGEVSRITIDLQIATKFKNLPPKKFFQQWINKAAKIVPPPHKNAEICIRIVAEKESTYLNETYRHKKGATNILSFDYGEDAETKNTKYLLGDLVICAPIVFNEAKKQNKPLLAHWAHIIVHGYLHLLGYDHRTDKETKRMEKLEHVITLFRTRNILSMTVLQTQL